MVCARENSSHQQFNGFVTNKIRKHVGVEPRFGQDDSARIGRVLGRQSQSKSGVISFEDVIAVHFTRQRRVLSAQESEQTRLENEKTKDKASQVNIQMSFPWCTLNAA